MKTDFHTQYRPLTSRPFLKGELYTEYAPCELLAPYVVCFWESVRGSVTAVNSEVLVIPDTCADIIIEINHTRREIRSRLTGLSDSSVMIRQKTGDEAVTTFAVRFYFWAVHLFVDVGMKELYNQVFDFELVDPAEFREFEALLYITDSRERIAWMESRLLKRLIRRLAEKRHSPDFYNSIDRILQSSGVISVKEICDYSCVSQRQMERLFQQNIGISIKRVSSLVRYQNVWREVAAQDRFDIQGAVYRYGYADQSHLLNEFKRFHGVTPERAKRIALSNR